MAQEKPIDKHERFKQDWLTSLMKNMDDRLDESTRMSLMESCGRDCARRGAITLAESSKGDVEKLVQGLKKWIGDKNAVLKGNEAHLQYDKCFCELVGKGPERFSDTWCNCSVGWVKQMFETTAQKPVKVELVQSIKRGAPSCKFVVNLG
ncbi:MAG: DUF6144 family protein [bacterium]